MHRPMVWCCAALLLIAPPASAQGNLHRVRMETNPDAYPFFRPVRPDPPPDPLADRRRSDRWFNPPTGNSSGSAEAFGLLVIGAGLVATSPFWLPNAIWDEGYAKPGVYTSYPYADSTGYMQFGDDAAIQCDEPDCGFWDAKRRKRWALRLSLEDGNDFGGINRLGGQLFLDTAWRVGVLANANFYHERLTGDRFDDTWLGDLNLTWRFTQSERVQFHLGVGARWQLDRVKDELGINLLYRAEVYPLRHTYLAGLFEFGTLHEAWVFHGRAEFGLNYRRWQGIAGYDWLLIGETSLQGPFLGLRVWF